MACNGCVVRLSIRLSEQEEQRCALQGAIVDLSAYHGKRICMLLPATGKVVRACGVASYEKDELLGAVLRIRVDSPKESDELDLFISEKEWNGEITTDPDLDCDFCFVSPPDESSR